MSAHEPGYLRACRVEEIPLGEGRVALVGGLRVAIFRGEQGFHCTQAACPHLGGPLADGILADASITCPLHQRRFALDDGAPLGHDGPALTVHPVRVVGQELYVCVRPQDAAAAAPQTRRAIGAGAD